MTSAYTRLARERIERIVGKCGRDDPKALRRATVSGYQFSRRSGWAYRVWLREVKAMTGIKNRNRNNRQLDMFEESE